MGNRWLSEEGAAKKLAEAGPNWLTPLQPKISLAGYLDIKGTLEDNYQLDPCLIALYRQQACEQADARLCNLVFDC